MKMIAMMLTMMVLFLGGILIGINQVNKGVVETRGYTTDGFEGAVDSDVTEEGTYQVSLMGEDFQQVDLEEKEEKYDAIQSTHFTQKLAGNLESGVKWFYNKMIDSAYQLTQVFF